MIFETFEKGAYISTTEWTKNGQKIVLKVINNNQNRFQMMGDYWIKVIVPRESILILKNNCKNIETSVRKNNYFIPKWRRSRNVSWCKRREKSV